MGQYSHRTLESLAMYDESEVPLDVIVDLVQHIHNYEGEGAILIFLSGWEEISAVREYFLSWSWGRSRDGLCSTWRSIHIFRVSVFRKGVGPTASMCYGHRHEHLHNMYRTKTNLMA